MDEEGGGRGLIITMLRGNYGQGLGKGNEEYRDEERNIGI